MSGHTVFDFAEQYILENARAELVPFLSEHIKALMQIADDPSIWQYFLDSGLGKEKFLAYAQRFLDARKKKEIYSFVVFDKETSAIAGMTCLYAFNANEKSLKIGHTWLGRQFWGTGLNKHVKFLLFEFVFEKLNLEKIRFGVHSQNTRSLRALDKIEARLEQVLKNRIEDPIHKKRYDLVLLIILKQDWDLKIKQ